MGLNIGIVGATGAVGQKILEVLFERDIPIEKIRLFASEKSEGKVINIDKYNISVAVEKLTEEVMKEKYDYLLFAAGGSIAEKYAPIAADAGNTIIDNSSHFRMKEYIPLIVPEVNGHILKGYKGIISNPNCSTIEMLVAIAPLHKKYGIKRIIVSTYQAVSGSGYKAIEELKNQVENHDYINKVYPKKIFGNCIPHIDVFNDNGFTKEELKMVYETHKILEDSSIEINDRYDVLINGISSNGTDNRDAILKMENEKSLAITYDKLMDLRFGRRSADGLERERFVMFNEFQIKGKSDVPYAEIQIHEKALPLLNNLDEWNIFNRKINKKGKR